MLPPSGPIKVSDEDARHLLDYLNENGLIHDGPMLVRRTGLEKVLLHQSETKELRREIFIALRQVGYDGPDLELESKRFYWQGAVHWLYNPGKISREDAQKFMMKFVSTWDD